MSSSQENKVKFSNLKKTYLRLLSYSLRYKKLLLLSLFSMIFFAATNAGFLSLIKKITDEGLVEKNQESIAFLPLALFILMIFRAGTNFISNYSLRWVSRKVVEDLRLDVFKNIIFLPASFFDKIATGNLVSKITMDTEQLTEIVTKVSLDTLRDSLTLIAILAYMFYLDFILSICFLTIFPIILYYLKKASPRLRESGVDAMKAWYQMVRIAEEVISGQRIVKVFGSYLYELSRFSSYAIRYRKMKTKLAKISGVNSFFVEIISGVGLALIVFYSMNNFSAGEFAAFATALIMLLAPLRKLTQINEQIQVGYSYADSVFKIIDERKELDFGANKINKTQGNIEFRNVCFSYDGKKNVLNKINFKIKSGEKIALVGKSGGGKSTIINLIPLFYNLNSGSILIDGIDTKSLKLADLREQISLVSQDTILFNDSIKNNIAYGKSSSISKIKIAAKSANASEFIDELPMKYNHIIGDRGVKLSGGQKQRIAIARAVLKDAPILLLDEATSSLDSESEKLVQKALDNLMKNRTSIVVAHRLSTILNANKIIVIHNGKVVGIGKHKELLKNNNYYLNIFNKGFN